MSAVRSGRRSMEGRNVDRLGKDKGLIGRLISLVGFQPDEIGVLDGYLTDHTMMELFWDYPTLGFTTGTEKKLETIRMLDAYDGRDVSWKHVISTAKN